MFSHSRVWAAIDALAQQNDMSVSRLARNAGLDPTTFNKSKRTANDGRLRWPSTESLSKIITATGIRFEQFAELMGRDNAGYPVGLAEDSHPGLAEGYDPETTQHHSIPLIGIAQAGSGGFFDDAGLPTGDGWDAVDFPNANGDHLYALEIQGNSMHPLYRDGDRIIVSPTGSIRRGDRVVVRTHDGEVMAKVLTRQTATKLELESINPEHASRTIDVAELDWMARIVWASQ
jgi:phage repressor protein C with HTH and peptisase S24 domain